MELYSENENYKLYHGDMLDMLEKIEPNSIDSIVTDPPYELNFMGKGWDNSGIAFQSDTWKKCYDVLKPGGYLLAFGGSRTFHRIAYAIEDAGFEIRDTIMWLYGSGFPKSMDVGKAIDKKNGVQPIGRKEPTGGITGGKNTGAEEKGWHSINNWFEYPECQNEWKGWGTTLKPSFEPIIVARKPFKGSLVDNVIEYGVGGINIDECRVGNTSADNYDLEKRQISKATGSDDDGHFLDQLHNQDAKHGVTDLGRFPANTILTYDETDFDEVCGGFPKSKGKGHFPKNNKNGSSMFNTNNLEQEEKYLSDSGSASRYFYCAKASKKDRDEGLDEFKEINGGSYQFRQDGSLDGKIPVRKNTHPTVKPTELMQYLVRLVSPNGATILDPFNGSGSTGKAVMYENKERNKNYKYIGIELTEEYLPIAKARIEYAMGVELNKEKIQEKAKEEGQTTIFDFIGE